MTRTRGIATIVVIMTLIASAGAIAKTGTKAHNEVMQAGLAGSVKLVTKIFSDKRPTTTPLLEWARAATERAKRERLSREAGRTQAPNMSEEEMMFSRDRD